MYLNKCKKKIDGIYDNLKFDDFTILELKGQGSFGKVYKCKFKKTNKIYAIKTIPIDKIKSNFWEKQIKNEIEIMEKISHNNIIEMYSYFEDEINIYIVLEYCDNGNLFTKIKENGVFSEADAGKIVLEILMALKYLHSKKPIIIHRDIKLENLLISGNNIKIVDFGWSNFKNDIRNTYCGTPDYLSPEMLKEIPHNEKIDIWALGIVIYELIHGKPPFSPTIKCSSKFDYINNLKNNILKKEPIIEKDTSSEYKEIWNLMLKKNFKDRSSAHDLLNHNWFKNIISSKLLSQNICTIGQGFSIKSISYTNSENLNKLNFENNKISPKLLNDEEDLLLDNNDTIEINENQITIKKNLEKDNNFKLESQVIIENMKKSLINDKKDYINSKINEISLINQENKIIIDKNEELLKINKNLENTILELNKKNKNKYKEKIKILKKQMNNLQLENNELKDELGEYKKINNYNNEKLNDINNIFNENNLKSDFENISNITININQTLNKLIKEDNINIIDSNISNDNEFNKKIIQNINDNFKNMNLDLLKPNPKNYFDLNKKIEDLEKSEVIKNNQINDLKLKLVEMDYHIKNNNNLFTKVNNQDKLIFALQEKIKILTNDLNTLEKIILIQKQKIEKINLKKNIK